VLGRLPLVADLGLENASTPPDVHFNEDTSKFLPKLRSLKTVAVESVFLEVACLNVLARWSNIPTLEPVALRLSVWGPVSIQGWGVGWVAAALASRRDLTVVLADDDDIALYVAAAAATASSARVACCDPTVLLGESVTPAGFSRLLCAAQLPSNALRIGAPYVGNGVAGPGLKLTPEYGQQLYGMSAPGLHLLHITDCSMLTDWDVAVLVGALPGLRRLQLGGAALLTDAALIALVGCPQLVSVRLGVLDIVTAKGIVMALVLLKELRELWLDDLSREPSAAFIASVCARACRRLLQGCGLRARGRRTSRQDGSRLQRRSAGGMLGWSIGLACMVG
jgi:hypothetical protein